MTCPRCKHQFCFICMLSWTGFHSDEGCPQYGDPTEGYDDEGYEKTKRGLHLDTGLNRAGANRFDHSLRILSEEGYFSDEDEHGETDHDTYSVNPNWDWDRGSGSAEDFYNDHLHDEQIIVYDGKVQTDAVDRTDHVEDLHGDANSASISTVESLPSFSTRRRHPPADTWEQEELYRRRHVPIFAPCTTNARYYFPTLDVTPHQEDCDHHFCQGHYGRTKYFQAACPICSISMRRHFDYCTKCGVLACNYCEHYGRIGVNIIHRDHRSD